jgi:TfoX/Sxy family transcriptional regulator of competence genes
MPNRSAFIVVFALVANNEVYLKADVVNQPSFVARGQGPPEIFEDREAAPLKPAAARWPRASPVWEIVA